MNLTSDFNLEALRWREKLIQAFDLAFEISMNLTEFDNKIRSTISCDEKLKTASESNAIEKESIKLHICLLLAQERRVIEVGDIYKCIKTLMPEQKLLDDDKSNISWSKIRSEIISAIIELESEGWIEVYRFDSPLDFDFGIPPKRISWPFIYLISDHFGDFPYYSTVRFEAGLRLLAIQLLDNSLQYDSQDKSDLIKQIDDDELEIDKFSKTEEIIDSRKLTLQYIVQRQGQPKFRGKLIEAYDGKCAITGFDVKKSLEAAHIIPYLGSYTNHLSNGLLLRADLHTLFDLFLFTIDPQSLVVLLSPDLEKTCYADLGGKKIRERMSGFPMLSKGALQYHVNQCKWAIG